MMYREFPPSPALAPYIDCFWILEHGSSSPGTIFPDGSMELVFNFGDPFRHLRNGFAPERQPRSFVVGEISGYMRVQPATRAGVIGVRFRPGGAYPFFRLPQDELADRVVGLDLIWAAAARELQQRILDARSNTERTSLVEGFLRARLSEPVQALVQTAVQRIVAAGGVLSIRALAGELGVSERQLLRCFRKFVGVNPKLFARIRRFHRILKALESPRWADAALECGYSDQAHFIREFREFSGQTPSFYVAHEHALSDCFV